MPRTLLFLLGGSQAYEVYADYFVAASGGDDARIVALMHNRAEWERHRSEIIWPWKQRGVRHYKPIFPKARGVLDVEKTSSMLQEATGIFIGGGHTPSYQRLFATGTIRDIIRERYLSGVPVAGISAGALICMEICQLTPDETRKDSIEIVPGLGLAGGFVVGVHFSGAGSLSEVLDAMAATRTTIGVGIDDSACVVCKSGKAAEALGRDVYKIKMTNFDKCSYRMAKM